ncbi:MAG: type VI secretion system contractile sheath small subunit, partial [Pseudomonadota bacterium]
MAKHPTMTFDFAPHASARKADPEAPMRILLIANFSGEATGQGGTPLADRRPIHIDIDNIDCVIERLSPSISLPLPGGARGAPVSFAELEDFHPDTLYAHVD